MTRYLAFIVGLLVVSSASAGLITIDDTVDGVKYLNPNQAGQQVRILISGGEPIDQVTFKGRMLLQNGATPTFGTAPTFTGVDVAQDASLLFYNKTNGPKTVNLFNFTDYANFVTGSSTTASGLLGILTVSTAGLQSGTFRIAFTGTSLDYLGTSIDLPLPTNGWLEIQAVPEPASMALMAAIMACGAPALFAYRRRRRISATPAC